MTLFDHNPRGLRPLDRMMDPSQPIHLASWVDRISTLCVLPPMPARMALGLVASQGPHHDPRAGLMAAGLYTVAEHRPELLDASLDYQCLRLTLSGPGSELPLAAVVEVTNPSETCAALRDFRDVVHMRRGDLR